MAYDSGVGDLQLYRRRGYRYGLFGFGLRKAPSSARVAIAQTEPNWLPAGRGDRPSRESTEQFLLKSELHEVSQLQFLRILVLDCLPNQKPKGL